METITACLETTLLKGLKFVFGRTLGANPSRGRRGFWRACFMAAGLVSSAHALQLTIAWDINSVGELGFNIERSQDGTSFVQIATVAAGVSSYTDGNVAAGTYWYRVRAFNSSSYSAYSNVASTQTAVSAPSFTTQPASQSVAAGANVSFSAVAAGSPTPTLQWKKNGVIIAGATGSSLSLSNVSSADAASYTVVATNSAGSVTSISAVLTLTTVTVVPPPEPVEVEPRGQLQNVSARALPGNGGQALTMNFTVTGGDSSTLVRAVGPGLDAFTTVATFGDPKLAVSAGGTTIASNDNWGGSSTLASVFSQVGAFPLAPNSKDAALLSTLSPKSYSAALSGKTGGIAMMEVYDADIAGGRISRVDVSAPVGSGEARLIGGFTITGSAPLRVLIRAIGLGGSKRNAGLDPVLDIHRGTTLVQRNDNWGGAATLKTSFELAGASSLSPDSSDAAIDVTLDPGTYTATVAGVNNSSGMAQLEIFEIR